MPGNEDVIRGWYEHLSRGEMRTQILSPDLYGYLTDGLANGWGGEHRGREAMVGTWGAIGEAFDMRPEPEAFCADGERVAVLGRYVGRARETGKPVEAAFAHFWRLRDGLAVEIRQVTDSQAWNEALRPDG